MKQDKSDYVYRGDTWALSNVSCPECRATMQTNFRIRDCTECEYWELHEPP
jgi:hypothetical protein